MGSLAAGRRARGGPHSGSNNANSSHVGEGGEAGQGLKENSEGAPNSASRCR